MQAAIAAVEVSVVRNVSPGRPPLRFMHATRVLGAACAATFALLAGAPIAGAFDDGDRHGRESRRPAARFDHPDGARDARFNRGREPAFGFGAVEIGHRHRDEDRHRHGRRDWHHGRGHDDWRWQGDHYRPCPPRGNAFGWHRPAPFFRCGPCGHQFASHDALLGHVHHHHRVPWRRARSSVVELNFGFIFR